MQKLRRRRSTVTKKDKDKDKGGLASSSDQIPLRLDVVNKLCAHITVHYLEEEGLFRVPGQHSEVQALYSSFTKPVAEIEVDRFSAPAIASALKQYIRDQPETIIPQHAFEPLLASFKSAREAQEKPCQCDRVHECECVLKHVRSMVHILQEHMPAENKPIFRTLWELMGGFMKHVHVNQMTPENLGVCLGPALLSSDATDPLALADSYKISAEILALLFHNYELVLNAFPLGHSSYTIFSSPEPFSDSDWAVLASTATIIRHVKGEVVWEADAENTKLYRIAKGVYAVKKKDGTVIAELGRHQVLGEMSFLGRRRTSAQVVCAQDDSEIVEMDTHLVNAMLEADPKMMLRFYFMLSRKLAQRLIDTNATEIFKHSTSSNAALLASSSEANLMQLIKDNEPTADFGQNLSSLLRIICDEELRALLASFLKSRYSSELLDFWLEVESYQACTDMEERATRAQSLYRTYIMPGAAKELCISDHAVIQRIESSLDSVQSNLFDEVRVLAGEMIVADHLGKFYASRIWMDRDKGEDVWYLAGGQGITITYNLEDTVERLLGSSVIQSRLSEDGLQLYFVSPAGARQFEKSSKYSQIRKGVAGSEGRFVVSSFEPPLSVLGAQSGTKKRKQFSNTVLKEYKCKYGKRSGTLYVAAGYLAHFSRKMGLEQKKMMYFTHITGMEWKEKSTVITISLGSEEKVLSFESAAVCSEAYRIMHTVWLKQNNDATEEQDDKRARRKEEHCGRVLITEDFSSPSPTFLDVQKGDILLATAFSDLAGEKIVSLSKGNQSGWVPLRYTEKLFDPDAQKELESRGYERCVHLPTRQEWHLLLMGGRETKYEAGEVILRVEDAKQSMYHIVSGSAVVRAPQGLQLATLKEDEVFGELSVLLGGGARAQVIAGSGKERQRRAGRSRSAHESDVERSGGEDEHVVPEREEAHEETVVFEIAAPYLSRVCREHPKVAAHFFKYIATVVETRLRSQSLK